MGRAEGASPSESTKYIISFSGGKKCGEEY